MEIVKTNLAENRQNGLSLRKLPAAAENLWKRVNQLCGPLEGYSESTAQRLWTTALIDLEHYKQCSYNTQKRRNNLQSKQLQTFKTKTAPQIESYLFEALGNWIIYALNYGPDGILFLRELEKDIDPSELGSVETFKMYTESAAIKASELLEKQHAPPQIKNEITEIFKLIEELVALDVEEAPTQEQPVLKGSLARLEQSARAIEIQLNYFDQHNRKLFCGDQAGLRLVKCFMQRCRTPIEKFNKGLEEYKQQQTKHRITPKMIDNLMQTAEAVLDSTASSDSSQLANKIFRRLLSLGSFKADIVNEWILLQYTTEEVVNHTAYVLANEFISSSLFSQSEVAALVDCFLTNFEQLEQAKTKLEAHLENAQDPALNKAFHQVFRLHNLWGLAVQRLRSCQQQDLESDLLAAEQLRVAMRYLGRGYHAFAKVSKLQANGCELIPLVTPSNFILPKSFITENATLIKPLAFEYLILMDICIEQTSARFGEHFLAACKLEAAQSSTKQRSSSGKRRGRGNRRRQGRQDNRRPVAQAEEPKTMAIEQPTIFDEPEFKLATVESNPSVWQEQRLTILANKIKPAAIIGDVDNEHRIELRRVSKKRLQLLMTQLEQLLGRLQGAQSDELHFDGIDEARQALDLCRQLWESALDVCQARYPLAQGDAHILFSNGGTIGAPRHGHDLWASASTLIAAGDLIDNATVFL